MQFAATLFIALLLLALPGHADERMGSHHATGNPHLRLTGARTPTPEDEARYRELEATVRREFARYRDVAVAIAEGYALFRPDGPQKILHYSKRSHGLAAVFGFDPAKPTSLLYRREPGGGRTLLGVMYTAPWWTDESELDRRVPLAVAPWHQHVDLCMPGRRQRERWTEMRNGRPVFGPGSPIASEADCEAVGGKFVERAFGWMVHVEAFAQD